MRKFLLPLLLIPALTTTTRGGEPVSLIDPDKPAGGWEFGNGPEFPGARGKIELADEPFRGKPVLSIFGDFTGGGNYVQAWVALPETEPGTLSLWVNSPAGSKRLPIRFTDAEDKCHQINFRLNEKGGWQHLVLPLGEFFRKMGTSEALDTVVGYESWDAAADREKHHKRDQPSPNLAVLASRAMGTEKGTVLVSDVLYRASAEAAVAVEKTVPLDEMLQAGELDWGFNLGQEFPGAKGGLDLVSDQPSPGQYAMKLYADFTGGGAYVGVRRSFSRLDVETMNVLRLTMRSSTTRSFAVRMVDATGQCHQRKDLPFQADGKWHEVELVPTEIAGGEHWGGANDGAWHGSVRLVELMLNVRSDEGKKPDLTITGMQADVTVAARVRPAALTEPFDAEKALADRWQTGGDVQLDDGGFGKSARSLLLKRSLGALRTDTWASGPAFDVQPGAWQVKYAWRAQLHSPDNSYHGSVALEVLDRGDKPLETIPVAIGYGKADWTEVTRPVTLPRGAARARFRIELKKTYGSFWVDELSASPLSTQPIEPRVERVLLATDALGNLFLPGDLVAFHVTVEAVKPLPQAQHVVRYSLRDYWGAGQAPPGEVGLEKAPRKGPRFVYAAEIVLPADRLEVGRYYELHVAIPQESGEPVREYSGLAILPPPRAKQFAPEDVPFTIRNWDSRIPVYFRLADRLGLRLLGVWGGWKAKEPYKPHCPGIDLVRELRAKWVTGTPASSVERKGFEEYSEEALRKGMKNFLEAYAEEGLAMIAMGNEPHGTGEKVRENVRAYRAIYETVKAFDPEIHVIGTSVEPNEEYFKAGYQNYLDSYDFHIYEHYTNVRRTMQQYRALMDKYHAVKPIHSTELGLNSQGQTRHAVSVEMIKKITVFFAEGGATVSWFTIQYPDPKGKARGQFGDAHCMFDCKYNLYNSRLDAVTHYHLLNGICDKKFVEKRHYPDGVQAYLFRDASGACLQVLWWDEARGEHLIPLPANVDVELVRLDGSHATLRSAEGGVSLTLSAEPVLLLYEDKKQGLAEKLAAPTLSLAAAPSAVEVAPTTTFTVEGPGLTAPSLRVIGPPLWTATLEPAGENRVVCHVRAPDATPAREARFHVHRLSAGNVVAETTVPAPVARAD